ncbi:phosphate acyltransferase [Phaeovulum sp. NW3]|uniref:phosphate acyltransferase n=1 Tax=Phaeovulum sp. NW3 TaxID=2934933 RepID=UPI0020215E6F|nr:phosphate acyltransferase [Phaeovulum sp. NW3]MCL7465059.1 phosphate acyltransferase [Phaeovulum sp. NW3]
MVIRSFAALRAAMAARPPLDLAVAGGDDPNVLAGVIAGFEAGLVASAAISGDAGRIAAALPAALRDRIRLLSAETPAACAAAAVAELRAGRAGVLMKGHVDSAAYLRAVVDRDAGIRGSGILSNLTLAEMPSVPRLIGATDNGIIPAPTLEQKRAIVLNALPLFRGLGLDQVRVAAIAASEKVSDRQPATGDAAALAAMARAGDLPGLIIDGPFGYDVAISRPAAEAKGLGGSDVAGQADLILFPNIEAANATAKAWKLHGQAQTGSLVLGAAAPVLLNSRADGPDRRVTGLIMAHCVLAGQAACA